MTDKVEKVYSASEARLYRKAFETRQSIYHEIENERIHQDERFGGPEHDDKHSVRDWVFYMVGYTGKIVTAPETNWGRSELNLRRYFVKVAALCVAALEALDRRKGEKKNEGGGVER